MKSLFEGIIAIGRDSWGPSRDALSMDNVFSSTSTVVTYGYEARNRFNYPVISERGWETKRKHRKKDKSVDEDDEIQAILKTLTKIDDPNIEECNRVLREMIFITVDDPLYCMALILLE